MKKNTVKTKKKLEKWNFDVNVEKLIPEPTKEPKFRQEIKLPMAIALL